MSAAASDRGIRASATVAGEAEAVNTSGEAMNTAGEAANTASEAVNTAGEAANTSGEAENTAGEAANTSGEAENTAGEAVNTASEAENTAGEAVNTAGEAVNAAGQAVNTAGEAMNTDGEAENTAGEAANTTGEAENTAGEAVNRAGEAENTAGEAENTSGEAVNTAGEAANTAGEAVNTAAEAANTAGEAANTASEAVNTTGEAENTAGEAENTAGEAVNTAAEAANTAGEVVNIADAAVNTAGEAVNTASEAANTAGEAENTAGEAVNKAGEAVNTVGEAVNTAGEAVNAAGQAVDTAGEAANTAGGADNTAGGADNTAGEAANTAGEAVNTAGGAENTAGEAANTAGEVVNTAGEAVNTAGEAENTSGEVVNTAGEAADTAGGAENTAGEAVNTAGEAADTAGGAENTAGEAENTAGEAANTTADTAITAGEAVNTAGEAKAARGTAVEWDWMSGLPLCQLHFILSQFMPAWSDSFQKQGPMQENRQQFQADLEAVIGDSETMGVKLCGSFFEELFVPPFFKRGTAPHFTEDQLAHSFRAADIDVMYVVKGKPFGDEETGSENPVQEGEEPLWFYIETESCHPGYLRLRRTDATAEGPYYVLEGGCLYMSSALVTEDQSGKSRQIDLAQFGQTLIQQGPSGCIRSATAKTAVGHRDQDTVITMSSPRWPKAAAGWLTRRRPYGWPTAAQVETLAAQGCLAVPIGHAASRARHLEWRFSFSVAEKALALSLTVRQRQAYVIFKALTQYALSPSSVLATYALKTVFFWTLERTSPEVWADGEAGLARGLLALLDRLLHCLIRHDLPHYFIPSNNLIGHVAPDFIHDLTAKVSRLRQDPLKTLFEFDTIYKFRFSALNFTLLLAMNALVKDCSTFREEDTRRRYGVFQFEALKSLLLARLKDCNFLSAEETAKECSAVARTAFHKNWSFLALYNEQCLKCRPYTTIEAFKYIIERYPDISGLFLANSGCIYHMMYRQETPGSRRAEELRDNAERAFQRALQSPSSQPAGVVDYATFLVKSERHLEAVPLLKRFISDQEPLTENWNVYNGMEVLTLDERLAQEHAETGELTLPSVVMAYYQLIECYVQTAQGEGAGRPLLEDFAAVCSRYYPDTPHVHAALGYAALSVENYDVAATAFKQALKLNPKSGLASENLELCQAIQLSKQDITDD